MRRLLAVTVVLLLGCEVSSKPIEVEKEETCERACRCPCDDPHAWRK